SRRRKNGAWSNAFAGESRSRTILRRQWQHATRFAFAVRLVAKARAFGQRDSADGPAEDSDQEAGGGFWRSTTRREFIGTRSAGKPTHPADWRHRLHRQGLAC